MAQLFIDLGSDIEAICEKGCRPFYNALASENLIIMQLLFDEGAVKYPEEETDWWQRILERWLSLACFLFG